MATGEDRSGSVDDTQASGQHHRGRVALFVALGLLAAGGIGAAVALAVSGGDDETDNRVEASAEVITTTTPGGSTTTATTTQTTTARSGATAAPKRGTTAPKGGTTAPKGGTTTRPNDAPVQAPAGGSTNQSAPATTTPPPATEVTTPTRPATTDPTDFGMSVTPRPEFTQAYASPDTVICAPGEFVDVNVQYRATNSDRVDYTPPDALTGTSAKVSTGTGTIEGSLHYDGCATNAVTLTATGPGGTTTTTVSWVIRSPLTDPTGQ